MKLASPRPSRERISQSPHASFPNPNFRPHTAEVAIMAGGQPQVASRSPDILSADVAILSDVQSEVEGSRAAYGIARLPLAVGHTLHTLAKSRNPSPELLQWLENRPGVSTDAGLGQIRQFGHLAAEMIASTPEFLTFINSEVLDRLNLIHNGEITTIVLTALYSAAGATGSGSAQNYLSSIAAHLGEVSSAVIEVSQVVVGSMSYLTCGQRIHLNTAATIAEALVYATDPTRPDNEGRRLWLYELPMAQRDRQLRDRYAAQAIGAFRSPELRFIAASEGINSALNSNLGAVTIGRPSFYRTLPGDRVTAEVQAEMSPKAEALLKTQPATDDILDVTIKTYLLLDRRPTAENVIEKVRRAGKTMPEGCVDEVLQESGYGATVEVSLANNETLVAQEDFQRLVKTPLTCAEDYSRRLGLTRGIFNAVKKELGNAEANATSTASALSRVRAAVAKAIQKAFPGKLARLFANPRTALSDLKGAINRYREVEEKHARAKASVKALRHVLAETNREIERVEGLLRRLRQRLDRQREVSGATAQRLVDVNPDAFDDILKDLEQAMDSAELEELFARAVSGVTMAGLAHIHRAESDHPSAVANRIVCGDPDDIAPPWGGKAPNGERSNILVLPPLAEDVMKELKDAMDAIEGPNVTMVESHVTSAGLNSVGLEIVKPLSLSDIITPQLEKHLEEVFAEPYLYLTSYSTERVAKTLQYLRAGSGLKIA